MQAFLVSHTHWDREWYMTREKSRYLLVELMEELFSFLEENRDCTFMLDGQTIALEDYLEMRPDRRDLLVSLVTSGRISIGPWYVLPDEILISGESHIRNWLEGQRQCAAFGRSMRIGYLPDSFGHPSQLPQILDGLGMEELVFWRGLGPDATRTELTWKGLDGTEILGVNLPFSYGMAACMPEEPDAFVARLKAKLAMLAPLTDGKVILLMNGVDHVAPQKSFPSNLDYARKKIPDYELVYGTLEEYLHALRAQHLSLQKVQGELRSGCRAYVLGGTISTRMYLKQANFRAELLLERYAEPVSALSWALYGARYPEAELRHAWRLLLSNLPHDSICGCGIDPVHAEMMSRYGFLQELGDSILGTATRTFRTAERGHDTGWDGCFAVLNPLLHARRDDVRGSILFGEQLLRKVNFATNVLEEHHPAEDGREPTGIVIRDASGHEVTGRILSVSPEDTMHLSIHTQPEMFRGRRVELSFPARELPAVGIAMFQYRLTWDGRQPSSAAGRLENERFVVTYEASSATLRVDDKRTGRTWSGLHVFEDGGDAGDEYTYSSPATDRLVRLDPARASVLPGPDGDMVIRGVLRTPTRLAPDRTTRAKELVDVAVESRVSLSPDSSRIDVRTTVENAAEDHRLRVLFPLGVKAAFASAEGIFSVDDRPVTPKDVSGFADWVEPPSTNPQKSFVSVTGGGCGLAVANRGLPEHEVVLDQNGNAVIALTLLRCVGWLSRPDLRARRGNGGWTLPTPGAQCAGTHVFEYSIIPHAGSWQDGGVLGTAHEFAVPPLLLDLGPGGRGRLADRSLVRTNRDEIVLSALKKAESGDAVVLRMWNASARTVVASLDFAAEVVAVRRVDLAERTIGNVDLRDGRSVVELLPWKIVTLELDLTGNHHTGRVAPPDGPASV